jgi:hypothetical protein
MAPNLSAAPDGSVLMSWLAPHDDGHALWFARLREQTWSEPMPVAAGVDWFVNWADFPAIIELGDGTLVAHWLQKSSPETYAYDVMLTRSRDGGATWSPPERPHTDDTQTEHGFVSLLPLDSDSFLVAWLDGRETAAAAQMAAAHEHAGAMTLRARHSDSSGAWREDVLLDSRVCDCCQTAAVSTSRGVTVAYRGRTEGEIRDIRVINRRSDVWQSPYTLHEDGWRIDACPVNGPALAADGDRVAAAWFTGAADRPRVYAAFSTDGGDSFGPPVPIDEGRVKGRVGAVLLEDGSALISWLAGEGPAAEIRLRRIRADGSADPYAVLAGTSAGRASGFPRMVRAGARLVFAWTEAGESTWIRTAAIAWQ